MSPSLDRIRKALVEQVGHHCGVRPYAYAPDTITPPCVFVGSIDRTVAAMGGAVDLEAKLYLFVKAGGDRHLADLDEGLTGDRSMAAAIDSDPTLGLSGVSVTYDQAGDYSLHDWAGAQFWGIALELTIMLD